MSPLEDCCYRCARCGLAVCSDVSTDCGHDDTPTCPDCCLTSHADELLREALADWGKEPW
jgi:hypothetical protein